MHFLGNRQVNGLIIDGYTRDKATIEEMGIPQFTKGISIAPVPRNCRATAKDVNVPVPAAARWSTRAITFLVISTALW